MSLQLTAFDRQEFVERRFRYRNGEHVTTIGPTGCGKTYLVGQLLGQVAGRHRPVIQLVKKPRDPQINLMAKQLGLRIERSWPPRWSLFRPNDPPGYIVWPKTNFADVYADRAAKADVFRRAILHAYKGGGKFGKKPRILYVDDAYGISELLRLREELIEMWTEARSMDCGQWTSFQRPANVPLWAYSQAEHVFLFKDPDKRSRDRYREIGGVDGDTVRDVTLALADHQALYIRRGGNKMCIVNA